MFYYFDDIINDTKINSSNILLTEKLYENISAYNFSYKTRTSPKPLRIRCDKIDGFIISLDGKIKHLVLSDYGLLDKICDKIKYLISQKVVLQMVLIILLERSKLIYIIHCLLKKYWFFIMFWYSLSQLLIRMKINTAIIYF